MRRVGALWLACLLAVAGCSGDASGDPADPAVPVEATLPGPVPDEVSFLSPPPNSPPAPSFELELLDGTVVDVTEQWAQRPVVLFFFESWCTHCAEQHAEINELAEEYRDVVLFVGIGSQSSAEDMNAYVAEHGVSHPVGLDPTGDLYRRYSVDEPPLTALVSKGGSLVRGWPGGTDTLREQITEFLVEEGPER